MQYGNRKEDLNYQNVLIRHCNVYKGKSNLFKQSPLHGIIGVHCLLPLPLKILSPTLIYLGLLAILDSHINICLGVPNTYVALKQFNLLQHQFEAITLG